MLKIIKSKKAAEEVTVSLIHLLEIILAIAIVMVLIYFSLKLSGLFIGRQEYDSTINNMEALAFRVKELSKDKRDIASQTMVYSIPDNYILVGFSHNDNLIKTDCTGESIIKSRPKLCESKSCLCIYQNTGGITDWSGNDFDLKGGSSPIRCKPFEEKIVFLAPAKDSNFFGAQANVRPSSNRWPSYNYLALYGICGGFWRDSWGIRQIYLDKVKEGGNIFIVIAELNKKSDFKPGGGAPSGAGAQATY